MKLDFTNVEGQRDFTPIPVGKYVLEVLDYEQGTVQNPDAKNYGAETISFQFGVAEHEANPEEYVNRRIFDNITLVESSLWRLKALLEACGFESDGEIDFEPEELLESQFVGKVGVQKARKDRKTGEEYNPRNVVKSFHPLDEVEV